MSVPGDVVYDGKDFDMKLEAKPSATSLPLKGISGSVIWTLSGGGTLTLVSCPDMKEGVQVCKMRYSAGLTAGQTKLIKLQAVHDSTKETSSDTFTVATLSFSISVPPRITVNAPFTATITATDPTGATLTNYSGTVVPYLALMPGRPNIDAISNFINGVAIVQLKIHKPAWQMQLAVYDRNNSAFTGTSNTFRVVQNDANYVGLDLAAIPTSATSIRLIWTYLDSAVVSQYSLYRKDSAGTYVLLSTISTTTQSSYTDASLSAGTLYEYKIEAIDSFSNIISTDFASSIPAACTNVSSAPIGYTVWAKAQSPYCVTSSMNIGASLVIQAGVVVLFNAGVVLTFSGQIQVQGTPSEHVIFSAVNASTDAGAGMSVSSPSPALIDASYASQGGSGFKYTHFEFLGGVGYWQKPMYYGGMISRYSGGIVFENPGGSSTGIWHTIDGGVFVRQTSGIEPFSNQTGMLRNLIFFGGSSNVSAIHLKLNGGTVSNNLSIAGSYFAKLTSTTIACGGCASGGAITAHPYSGTTAITGPIQITDNQFYNNSSQAAGYNGGAILLNLYGTPAYTISNNTFVGNTAVNGGAISVDTGAMTSVTMNNNYFSGNSATTNGGAIRVVSGSAAFTMTNNNFAGNTGTGFNFYNTIAQNHNVQNSFWGTASPDTACTAGGRTSLGIIDACGGGGSGTVNAAGAIATAYPLCINDPTVSGCVGAR